MSSATGPSKRVATKCLNPKPQAWAGTPHANIPKWIESFGGISSPAGKFTTERTYILVGGGFGNMYLAWLLRLAGAEVTILEAKSQVGGRAEPKRMQDGTLAPMGMMRFSTSEVLWIQLLKLCDYELKAYFPNPGRVPTILSFHGKNIIWNNPNTIPEDYSTVINGFNTFIKEVLQLNRKTVLCSWSKITELLADKREHTTTESINAIQAWITTFKNNSIGDGFQLIFKSNRNWDVPGGRIWSKEHLERFNTVGVGSGGFGAFNHIDFMCIMHVIVNGCETEQGKIAKKVGRKLIEGNSWDVAQVFPKC